MNRQFTLLVPIDFSPASLSALSYAAVLAGKLDGRLVLFSAVHPLGRDTRSETSFPAAYDTDQAKRALVETRLQEIADAAARPAKVVARLGAPAEEIVKVAVEVKADMIVMGSHGRTGLARVFLGSVAEGVVRHAPCPVTVLRAGVHPEVDSVSFAPLSQGLEDEEPGRAQRAS